MPAMQHARRRLRGTLFAVCVGACEHTCLRCTYTCVYVYIRSRCVELWALQASEMTLQAMEMGVLAVNTAVSVHRYTQLCS
jgi:hypothetical protein